MPFLIWPLTGYNNTYVNYFKFESNEKWSNRVKLDGKFLWLFEMSNDATKDLEVGIKNGLYGT